MQLPTPTRQMPLSEPEPTAPVPHEALSQSAFLWQLALLVEHLPAVEPLVPLPHELLSQSAFLWQAVPARMLHAPLSDGAVPLPQTPLSQSAFL